MRRQPWQVNKQNPYFGLRKILNLQHGRDGLPKVHGIALEKVRVKRRMSCQAVCA